MYEVVSKNNTFEVTTITQERIQERSYFLNTRRRVAEGYEVKIFHTVESLIPYLLNQTLAKATEVASSLKYIKGLLCTGMSQN